LDHLFQTDLKATRIEFRELWRGEADCAVAARAFKSLRDKASTTAADAVFDTVVLPLYGAIERRLTRRLGNAGPRDCLAGRRQIILIEKMPEPRL
jgi:hypothetical protein